MKKKTQIFSTTLEKQFSTKAWKQGIAMPLAVVVLAGGGVPGYAVYSDGITRYISRR